MLFDHPSGRVQENTGVLLGQKADACCLRNLQNISPLASTVGSFPGLALCQPRCALVPSLSPAVLCPSRCDRALLAPEGGESHDVFLCVPVVWQSCKNQHFPILWIPFPFCQVGITLKKVPVPVREQFGGIQELLSLEQLLLVQTLL